MNVISELGIAHRASRSIQVLLGTGVLAATCLGSAPALAQTPIATQAVIASQPIGNEVAVDHAALGRPAQPNSASTVYSGFANPYGLSVVWGQGDTVSRTTLIVLTLMSLLSWYVILAKLVEQRRLNAQAASARAAFANTASLQESANALSKDSPFRFLVDSAVKARRTHEALAGQVEVGTWLSQDIVRNVGTLQMRMQSGLSILATVGSTAPFVGLFGTVWGIYNALVTIGSTGQASIDRVAGPVGEALIMTALGLAVAVPAVLGYNWLVRRNRVTLHSIKGFGSDLHTLFLIDIEKSRRVASRTAA